MKKYLLTLATAVALSTTLFAQTVHEWYMDGQIYFKLNDNIEEPNCSKEVTDIKLFPFLTAITEQHDIEELSLPFFFTKSPILRRTFLLKFNDITNADLIVRELENLEQIEYAEKVVLYKNAGGAVTPNDPGYASQYAWQLFHLNAAGAWSYSTGSKNIIIAVTDNASQTNNQDLQANIYKNPGETPNNGIDDDGNGFIDDVSGWDFGNNDNNPMPPAITSEWAHGTHVGGIAAGVTNNGHAYSSLSYNCSLLPCKGMADNNPANYASTMPMVAYAAEMGAHVINMSWGAPAPQATGQNTINYAAQKGSVLIAAAGNHGGNSKFYPAGFDNVIAVANTTQTDALYSSSAYGTWVDICAPGTDIWNIATTPGGAGLASGTSQAAPQVSALAGLMLSYNPNLTRTQVENCLLTTAKNINNKNPNRIGQIGAGLIDPVGAMQCVETILSVSNNHAHDSQLLVFPNPTSGMLHIKSGNRVEQVNIYDITGKQVLTKQYNIVENLTLDLGQFNKGFYLVEVHTQKGIDTRKIAVN